MTLDGRSPGAEHLRWMRWAALLEGTTLVLLTLVAVPLKHWGGYPLATALMGPVHGFAFLLYLWTLFQTVGAGLLPKTMVTPMLAAAFIPFGSFVTERRLRRRQMAASVCA